MYDKLRAGWNVVSLGTFIYFVGGTSESGECRVNMSNGSIRKFSLVVGLCYEMPFRVTTTFTILISCLTVQLIKWDCVTCYCQLLTCRWARPKQPTIPWEVTWSGSWSKVTAYTCWCWWKLGATTCFHCKQHWQPWKMVCCSFNQGLSWGRG